MDHPGIFILSAVIVMFPVALVLIRHPNLSKGRRLEKKAARRGYTAQAYQLECHDRSLYGSHHSDRDSITPAERTAYDVVYQFQVNGKVYYYRDTLDGLPPDQTTVYFPTGDPNKAFLKDFGPVGTAPIALVFTVLILTSIVYHALVDFLV